LGDKKPLGDLAKLPRMLTTRRIHTGKSSFGPLMKQLAGGYITFG
jgi:hypothetical protein